MVTTEQGLTQLQAKHAAKILGTTPQRPDSCAWARL
jgi:hypothetical protein